MQKLLIQYEYSVDVQIVFPASITVRVGPSMFGHLGLMILGTCVEQTNFTSLRWFKLIFFSERLTL